MQVMCRSTIGNAEARCSVCGQGFVIFWERESRSQRIQALREIQRLLRDHHRSQTGPQAHPQNGFLFPELNVPEAFSGAAMHGQAPSWAL
jgi:hypothetical protein